MRLLFITFLLAVSTLLTAQKYNGEIYIRDRSSLYLNQFYVTNLTTQKTVLADFTGDFSIDAKKGDVIRFTSIITERKDIVLTDQILALEKNYIELQIAYYEIQEVLISSFKPTGILKKDLNQLKTDDSAWRLKKIIGLPTPKGDGPVQAPIVGFDGGLSLSIDSLFDMVSGEAKKKKRLYEYEKMKKGIENVQKFFGDDYFTRLKIPKELIPNFLQFVYSSDNISRSIEASNYEAIKINIERYLPIYLRRLHNSNLMQITPGQNVPSGSPKTP